VAARSALQKLSVTDPGNVNDQITLAKVELLAIHWAFSQHKANETMFDVAFAPLVSHLDEPIDNPEFYVVLAEIHAERAAFSLEHSKNADEDIRQGLVHADRAIEKNPRLASAFAVQGKLWLAKARATRERAVAKEAAEKAIKSFETAIRENALLHASIDRQIKQARTFL
jgi:serine/threonine-protein kinase